MSYCTIEDVYRVVGFDDSVVSKPNVQEGIYEATAEINRMFQTNFKTEQITKTLDGNGTDELFLDYYPIQSINSLSIDSTSITTSKVYVYKEIGKIKLKADAEITIFKNTEPQQVTITYTMGYNWDFNDIDSNPKAYYIRKLASIIAGITALISQIGGTYNDVTSYTLPEFSASKGEPYTNIREALMRLDNQYKRTVESQELKSIAKHSGWV